MWQKNAIYVLLAASVSMCGWREVILYNFLSFLFGNLMLNTLTSLAMPYYFINETFP